MSLLLCSSFLSAQGQDQHRAAKRQQVALRVTSDYPYHKWLDEDVRHIITDQERADYIKLTTSKHWDDFVEAFWERRNPTPGSTENPFQEEHYRRFAYTNEHFTSGVGGWKTGRGRFYIMCGPPDSVDTKSGFALPTETWHYLFVEGIGRNVVLTFTEQCACGNMNCPARISIPEFPKSTIHYGTEAGGSPHL